MKEKAELSQKANNYLQDFAILNTQQQIDIFLKLCYNFLKKIQDRIGSFESIDKIANDYLIQVDSIDKFIEKCKIDNEYILADFLIDIANSILPALTNFNQAWVLLLDFCKYQNLDFAIPAVNKSILKLTNMPLDFIKMCHQMVVDLPGGPMESGTHDPMRTSYDALVDEMSFIFRHAEAIINHNADDDPKLKIIQGIINRIKLLILKAIDPIFQIHTSVEGYMDYFVNKIPRKDI